MKLGMLSAVVALLCLVACSQEVPSAPSPGPAQAAPVQAPVAETPDRLGADKFVLVLEGADCSVSPVAAARVHWDAGTLAADGIAVYVESPGNPRKLWMEASAKGEGTTGNWVFPGSRFSLHDRSSGELLAQRIVETIPCPGT